MYSSHKKKIGVNPPHPIYLSFPHNFMVFFKEKVRMVQVWTAEIFLKKFHRFSKTAEKKSYHFHKTAKKLVFGAAMLNTINFIA